MLARSRDTISTTELARNLATTIDRVRFQRRALAITKGKRTVALLRPAPQGGFPVAELGRMLAELPGLDGDAANLARDITRVRTAATLPGDPWAS